MKNIFKISAVALITFALASNLYASTFSFYGIKTNKLSNSILAGAMSESDGSTTGSGGGGDSSSGSFWDSPVNTPIQCGAARVNGGETSAGSAGATVTTTTNPYGQAVVTVSYASASNYNYSQEIAAHTATMRQCTGPNWAICTTITAIEACR